MRFWCSIYNGILAVRILCKDWRQAASKQAIKQGKAAKLRSEGGVEVVILLNPTPSATVS